MNNDTQAQTVFMEAINGLKEYARVNGGFVTKDDVLSYFKGMEMNESRLQMVYGYLMANNIRVKGEDQFDNSFLDMFESASDESAENEEASGNTEAEGADSSPIIVDDNIDYEADEKYLELYMEDIGKIEKLSENSRAFLLMNIVEDNDKESLRLLSESFLEKIVSWVEPFRRKGVLTSDLVQEGNMAMMAYVSEKRFMNNYEWKDKIKEGGTKDLLEVMKAIDEDVRTDVEGCIRMLIDEQQESLQVSNRVLNKVNLVNDWAKRLRAELGRKPTVKELAEKMGVSEENIMEAIQLSAENIEDVNTK